MTSDSEIARRHQAAWRSLQQGDLRAAWRLSQALNQQSPDFPPGWDLSSRVALAAGDSCAALELVEQALQRDPSNFSYLSQKAFCLLALKRASEASAIIAVLDGRALDSAQQYDTLGNLYSLSKDQGSAQKCFEQAVELEPGRAHYRLNLGLARQANGDLDGAETAFDRAIELDPENYEAWLHRSRLRRQSRQRNHVAEMETRITAGVDNWRGEMTLRYALAKEYEDLCQYPQSFLQLQRGSSLRRSHMRHDAQGDLDAIDAVMASFSSTYLETPTAAYDSREPIFIVGLPRTGTTLVERILGSHSEVFAAGELNDFAENLTRQVSALGGDRPKNRQQFIAAATRIDYAALGESYLVSTRPHTGHTPRFVDKLPLNFLYCGLILRALPNAKIIHLTRHPMDTCFAVYKTLFKQAYPFSYDLGELGDYYLAYRELMRHWHEALPGRILDVSYEQLTSGLEPECRNILSYCELAWEDACLEFHQNTAPSMTASLAQVRQPVYTSSIGRWRHYAAELRPLEDRLRRAGLEL